MMTIYRIKTNTYNTTYEEDVYGIVETVERMGEISRCNNVIAIEVMDAYTGEIVYHDYPTEPIYVSADFVVNYVNEILG